MIIRVYAEAMYRSTLWQVVYENSETQEHFVIKKNMALTDARRFSNSMQMVINEEFKEKLITETEEAS